ncbi:MAG: DUF131 domain-containing protein [Deltaproteobacteria bacterium]|nr:DUF131 domain-containing protein [Deltaproteobacteria bacterium]MBW2119116.1 DUF131 domain-containing protein [Deltaproteobacteria bacterium]MBW2345358.1 DUF131 domain-containing protein [Deltaproteobacteria bacterium]
MRSSPSSSSSVSLRQATTENRIKYRGLVSLGPIPCIVFNKSVSVLSLPGNP